MPLAYLPFDPYRTPYLTSAFDAAWQRLCAFGDHCAHDVEDLRTRLAFFIMSRAHIVQEASEHLIEEYVGEFRNKLTVE